jgi:hypothetical protein
MLVPVGTRAPQFMHPFQIASLPLGLWPDPSRLTTRRTPLLCRQASHMLVPVGTGERQLLHVFTVLCS